MLMIFCHLGFSNFREGNDDDDNIDEDFKTQKNIAKKRVKLRGELALCNISFTIKK